MSWFLIYTYTSNNARRNTVESIQVKMIPNIVNVKLWSRKILYKTLNIVTIFDNALNCCSGFPVGANSLKNLLP